MADMLKALGFGSHEQQVSPEEKQLLSIYYGVVDGNFIKRLRVVVWQQNPNIIYQEDGIPAPTSISTVLPSAARSQEFAAAGQPSTRAAQAETDYNPTKAANSVVYLAAQNEEEALMDELSERRRMKEDAMRKVEQAIDGEDRPYEIPAA